MATVRWIWPRCDQIPLFLSFQNITFFSTFLFPHIFPSLTSFSLSLPHSTLLHFRPNDLTDILTHSIHSFSAPLRVLVVRIIFLVLYSSFLFVFSFYFFFVHFSLSIPNEPKQVKTTYTKKSLWERPVWYNPSRFIVMSSPNSGMGNATTVSDPLSKTLWMKVSHLEGSSPQRYLTGTPPFVKQKDLTLMLIPLTL